MLSTITHPGHDAYGQEVGSPQSQPRAQGADPGRLKGPWRSGRQSCHGTLHQRQHRARLAQARSPDHRTGRDACAAPAFVPMVIEPPMPAPNTNPCIDIELRRGPLSVRIAWPLCAAGEMRTWMLELLR